MSSFWESKYLNSEKSIQFLQATHAEVLNGLHEEIGNLQKQCSDYALKLSMRATTALEKEEFDQKFKSFNNEYKKKDALIQEQQKLIEERNKNLKSLQERVKQLESKLETDSHSKDSVIKQLRQQLEAQSDQIALLTYQLHQLNKFKINATHSQSVEFTASLNGAADSSKNSSAKKKSLIKPISEAPPFPERSFETVDNSSFVNKIPMVKTRRNSAHSAKSDYSLMENHAAIGGGGGGGHASGLLDPTASILNRPLSSASNPNGSLLLTDRSSTPPMQKVLPPVIKRSSENVPPDPKPFLQSAASTLHSRTRKELIQRRTLISLPPINKSFELSHLVVESPHKNSNSNKMEHNNSSSAN